MTDLIIILVVAAILALAAGYIIKEKKKGGKCIGCPSGGCKNGESLGCGSCSGCHREE